MRKRLTSSDRFRVGDGLDNLFFPPDEDTAALAWGIASRVRDHRCHDACRAADVPHADYSASTAIAMPMPPPMQSDATP